nr:ribonuclease H-like domain-containing protein [Tanacetum cinerariifolium]
MQPTTMPGPVQFVPHAQSVVNCQFVMPAQHATPAQQVNSTQQVTPGQPTNLPHAFTTGTLHDPGAWNMDTDASSHYYYTWDLYPVTAPSPIPHVFLVSQHTWHQRLGHPGRKVLRHLVSNNFISCNKEKPPVLCHACQLGKHFQSEIRSFQCDHGGEFDNRNLHKLFADNGIQFRFSCPKTSQQNGRAHMDNCNSSRTTIDTESKLGNDGVSLYDDPREPHFSALKRILRYVRGTLDYGLQLFSSSTIDFVAYSDVDWAGCPTTRRSTSGYCVFLGNNLLSWSSKRQPTLSRSSAEVKYHGVANDVAETCWLRNLLHELHTPLTSATLFYYDNVGAVYLSCNLVQHERTKHIQIDIYFVRDLIAAGQVHVLHVPSRYQFAAIFTKGLPLALFEEFRFSLSVHCSPTPTEWEC